jgi:hypothetical protein
VSFFASADQLRAVRDRVDEHVLPRFSALPGFMGGVILQSEEERAEVLALSFWSEGLEASEPVSETLRDEIELLTGATPARKEYVVVSSTPNAPGTSDA